MNDWQEKLKKIFPDAAVPQQEKPLHTLWVPATPVLCKYEKRNGKAVTIIDEYTGTMGDFKELAQMIKKRLSVGGGIKGEQIIIQGNYRDQIMSMLEELGFKTKRVGG